MEPQTSPVFSRRVETIRLAASVPRADCWRNIIVWCFYFDCFVHVMCSIAEESMIQRAVVAWCIFVSVDDIYWLQTDRRSKYQRMIGSRNFQVHARMKLQ